MRLAGRGLARGSAAGFLALAASCVVGVQGFSGHGSMLVCALQLRGAARRTLPAPGCARRRGLTLGVVAQLRLPSQIDWEERGGGNGAGGAGAGDSGGAGGVGPGGHGERGGEGGWRGDRARGDTARLHGAERRYRRIQRSNA